MVYITVPASPMYHQMTLEELFSGVNTGGIITTNAGNTRTYEREQVSNRFPRVSVPSLIKNLTDYIEATQQLRQVPRQELYHTFYIPKHNGKFRRIDAPNPELMKALRDLKELFEQRFCASYHTSAFAYVKGRSTVDAVKRHQQNESRWFAKLDLSNFFGSTTPEFLLSQLSVIYPFSEVMKETEGLFALAGALDLAFLNGGLPQGTPISPMLTNLMMIPIDYKLSGLLEHLGGQKFIYTRYADDFLISSRYDFKVTQVEEVVLGVLSDFHAPFSLNREKTRYGSSGGRNWNLGVMLNKDNQITVGYKRKRQFKSMLVNYLAAKARGDSLELGELQHIIGLYSYYHMVEPETIDAMVASINKKFSSDVLGMMKRDMN